MIPATMNNLTALVEGQQIGHYTLPQPITAALETYERAGRLEGSTVEPYDRGNAAHDAFEALTKGQPVDLDDLAARIASQQLADAHAAEASAIALATLNLAAANAVATAADHAVQVITDHLRPAFDTVLDEAREVSADLGSTELTLASLIAAPAKARKAYERLSELVTRHQAISQARSAANRLAGLRPEHDDFGVFLEFRDRFALHPGWQPTQQVPRLPAPEDARERLLWLVRDAAIAQPWLPTIAEMDARWYEHFGKGIEDRRVRHEQARATFGAA